VALRIDPRTDDIVGDPIPVKTVFRAFAVGEGGVWFLSGPGRELPTSASGAICRLSTQTFKVDECVDLVQSPKSRWILRRLISRRVRSGSRTVKTRSPGSTSADSSWADSRIQQEMRQARSQAWPRPAGRNHRPASGGGSKFSIPDGRRGPSVLAARSARVFHRGGLALASCAGATPIRLIAPSKSR